MDAKRCDRCGSYYLRSYKKFSVNGGEYYINGIGFWSLYGSGNNKLESLQMDLCDDCIDELIEFMKIKKSEV